MSRPVAFSTDNPAVLPRQRGFTLLELMIVGTIIVMVATAGYPAFSRWKRKTELVGETNEVALHLHMARQEAVKMGVPVVIEIDPAKRELFVFANVDDDPGLIYQPDSDATFRTVDYELATFRISPDLPFQLRGPGNQGAVDGFETNDDDVPVIVYLPNGGVRTPGGLRVADAAAVNVFELRLNATGKLTLLKYNPEPSWGGDAGFYANGEHKNTGAQLWEWY